MLETLTSPRPPTHDICSVTVLLVDGAYVAVFLCICQAVLRALVASSWLWIPLSTLGTLGIASQALLTFWQLRETLRAVPLLMWPIL
jgi:hypothetical protein